MLLRARSKVRHGRVSQLKMASVCMLMQSCRERLHAGAGGSADASALNNSASHSPSRNGSMLRSSRACLRSHHDVHMSKCDFVLKFVEVFTFSLHL